jgi:hypothetical protein
LLDEAADAYEWYESRAPGLGNEFLSAFYGAIAKIQPDPEFFRIIYSDYRRIYLKRFPYFLYYHLEGDTIAFLLLFHCSRNPRVTRRELGKRRNEG